jgi:predicted XRE-type DNA-binding protein
MQVPPKPGKTPSMTAELAAHAKYLVQEAGLLQHQAAAVLGVNQGRISEVMTGKSWPDIPPNDQLSLDI